MLKKELEEKNKELQILNTHLNGENEQCKQDIKELEEKITGQNTEIEDLQSFYDNFGIEVLTLEEEEILTNVIGMLNGFRKGFGNRIEFGKFVELALERYKITI